MIYHVIIKIPDRDNHGTQIVTDDSGHWVVYTNGKDALEFRDRLALEDAEGDYLYQVMELEL